MFELTIALIIFLFPLAYSPGPGNMFFAANGAKFGFKETIPSNVGYHIATLIVTIIIGLGFDKVAKSYPDLFQIFGYVGSAYVLYLAWLFLSAGKVETQANSKKINFWDGVILLVLNPKAYVIISTMFSQFLVSSNSIFHIIWISTIFTLNNLVAFSLWTYLGDRLLQKFRSEKHAKIINTIFAIVLAGVAIWMFVKLL